MIVAFQMLFRRNLKFHWIVVEIFFCDKEFYLIFLHLIVDNMFTFSKQFLFSQS